jgi:hypothetical protein
MKGVRQIADHLANPSDASELSCSKVQGGALKDGFLDIDDKVAVGVHAGLGSVVHPGSTQGYAIGAEFQCTFLGLQFVTSIVVFRSYGKGLVEQSHLKVAIVHLVRGEEDEFASILGRDASEVLNTGDIHEVTIVRMLFAVAGVGQGCQMHDGIGAVTPDV